MKSEFFSLFKGNDGSQIFLPFLKGVPEGGGIYEIALSEIPKSICEKVAPSG